MPLLLSRIALPFELWNLLAGINDMLSKAFLYFTAFLASSSVLPNAVSAQYLLGLGELGFFVEGHDSY